MTTRTTTPKIYAQLKEDFFEAVNSASLTSLQEVLQSAQNDDERKKLINSESYIGNALDIAAHRGHINIIEWILSEQGGRAAGFENVLAPVGITVLHDAAIKAHLPVFLAIVHGCRVGEREKMLNAKDLCGKTVLHHAAENDSQDIIKWLLSEEEEGGRALGFKEVFAQRPHRCPTALHLAPSIGAFLAIVNGCQVENGERERMLNNVENDGWSVLHCAAFDNRPAIISWLLSEEEGGEAAGFNRDLVTALTTADSVSVLHFAARSTVECIRALLSHCTQQEKMNLFLAVDKNGWTVLHYAARYGRFSSIIDLLQYPECKMIANRKDDLGMTVLHRAIIGGLDEESLSEWAYFFEPSPDMITALLGSSEIGWTSIDPNIGLGVE